MGSIFHGVIGLIGSYVSFSLSSVDEVTMEAEMPMTIRARQESHVEMLVDIAENQIRNSKKKNNLIKL